MTETSQVLLQRFKEKKAEKNSTSLQEARCLVNLYRSLSCFGEDFVSQYNQMLLNVKPGVRRLLNTFMGGKEVEDYLEFLEQNAHLSKVDVEQNEGTDVLQTKGYLPSPEADVELKPENGMLSVSEKEWQELKNQNAELIQQKQALLNTLSKLGQKSSPESSIHSSFENYSEIIEDTSGEKSNE